MKTIRKTTSALASARARFGLTQQQMAMEMGLSVSMVKMVETNRRSLTSEKLVRLAALEIKLAAVQKNYAKDLPLSVKDIYNKAGSSFELEASYQERRCTQQASKLEKQLKKMEQDHESLMASLQNLDALAGPGFNASDPLLKSVLQQRPQLLKKLMRCSIYVQAKTRHKIMLLRAEAALHQSIRSRYVHTNEKPIFSPLKQSNMDYTVALISSRADCQAMIDTANDDKDALVYRKTGLERQRQTASATGVSIDSDLAAVDAEITALNSIIAGLPDGDTKDETEVKLKKADYKKFLLEQRKINYGSLSLVGKEYDIACIEQSIAETDAFIAALTTRMNELPAG